MLNGLLRSECTLNERLQRVSRWRLIATLLRAKHSRVTSSMSTCATHMWGGTRLTVLLILLKKRLMLLMLVLRLKLLIVVVCKWIVLRMVLMIELSSKRISVV